jgi:hypothetical protein
MLYDFRVDPGASNNDPIRDARYSGHASVVELLLVDGRVDQPMGHPTARERGSGQGRVHIVQIKCLLEHPKAVVTKAALVAADKNNTIVALSDCSH